MSTPAEQGPIEARARAKLTRTLRVVGRRDDGYHLLAAEMVSLDLADTLEIMPVAAGGERLVVRDAVAWSTGRAVPIDVPDGPDNLVRRALRLAERAAVVTLTKRIPPGSGLGGGSADAAAVLRWAGIDDPELAARLGADVPFCLRGGRAEVSGVGERLMPLPPLAATVVLCIPALAVSTAAVYAAFDDMATPQARGVNDLEPAALVVAPALVRWRDVVAEAAGRAPTLAGSGATWFLECDDGEGEALEKEIVAALGAAGLTASVVRCRTEGPLD